MRFYCTYKVPQESTATKSRKKRARKKGKAVPLESKARSKTSAVETKQHDPIYHSFFVIFEHGRDSPLTGSCASLTGQNLSVHSLGKRQSKESISRLPWLCQDKTKESRRKGNQPKKEKKTLHLDYSCRVLSEWMYRICMLLWALEELGLLFHVVAFPQGKPVKLLDLHSKDVKERFGR